MRVTVGNFVKVCKIYSKNLYVNHLTSHANRHCVRDSGGIGFQFNLLTLLNVDKIKNSTIKWRNNNETYAKIVNHKLSKKLFSIACVLSLLCIFGMALTMAFNVSDVLILTDVDSNTATVAPDGSINIVDGMEHFTIYFKYTASSASKHFTVDNVLYKNNIAIPDVTVTGEFISLGHKPDKNFTGWLTITGLKKLDNTVSTRILKDNKYVNVPFSFTELTSKLSKVNLLDSNNPIEQTIKASETTIPSTPISKTSTSTGLNKESSNTPNTSTATDQPKTDRYIITYILNGGVNHPDNPTTYIAETTCNITDPTKSGYAFLGWSVELVNIPTITAQFNYKTTTDTTGNITLTANWGVPIRYDVVYVLGDGVIGDFVGPFSYSVEDLSLVVADPFGVYEFLGWDVVFANGTSLTVQKGYVIPLGTYGNLKFVANWDATAYNIKYPSYADAITADENNLQVGVNYISTSHLYSSKYTTDEILERDFSKFKQDGIDVINLSLYWYRLEGNTQGSYNGTLPDGSIYGDVFLENVKHVIAVANQNGLKVMLTFHTLWGDDSTWCTPNYVIDSVSGKNIGLAIVRCSDMRQAYMAMFNHTVSYLADTPGIWAWAILNEPWYWGRSATEHDFITNNGQTQKENFLTLFQELSTIIKTEDGRLVTIRFCNTHFYYRADGTPALKNIFVDDWTLDSRLFNSIDFISFNDYLPDNRQVMSLWKDMTSINVNESWKQGKTVGISEFGYASSDSDLQATYIQESMQFYQTLPIEFCLVWYWQSDRAIPTTFGDGGMGYNLCADAQTGNARSAYNVLIDNSVRIFTYE
jgi:uncharacterized repeat protein (TIGR02543 family)